MNCYETYVQALDYVNGEPVVVFERRPATFAPSVAAALSLARSRYGRRVAIGALL